MKNRKKFWITFLFVCLCGLFILLAGGVKWGTVGCGFGAGLLFSQPGLSPTLSQAEGIGKWSYSPLHNGYHARDNGYSNFDNG